MGWVDECSLRHYKWLLISSHFPLVAIITFTLSIANPWKSQDKLCICSILTAGSFTEPSTEYLELTNTSTEPLAFKVKTTAPKLYCVRPNASIVPPGETVKISLILQGFTQPLPKDYKCKDKFLIVSLPCSELEDASKVGESWSALESKYKDQLLQKKLKVSFVIEEDERDESVINDTSYANATQSAPIVDLSIIEPEETTIIRDEPEANGTAEREVPEVEVAAPVAPATTVEKELAESEAQINDLSEKLDLNESAATSAAVVEEPSSGISIPLAVILVLIALLLGWFIF